jgi:hypothetical protein
MGYRKVSLFSEQKSRGTYDDFFNPEKYKTIEEAHLASDYVQGDFVMDENDILFIQLYHMRAPENKIHHRLYIQRPVAGIDVYDDDKACKMALKLLDQHGTN